MNTCKGSIITADDLVDFSKNHLNGWHILVKHYSLKIKITMILWSIDLFCGGSFLIYFSLVNPKFPDIIFLFFFLFMICILFVLEIPRKCDQNKIFREIHRNFCPDTTDSTKRMSIVYYQKIIRYIQELE